MFFWVFFFHKGETRWFILPGVIFPSLLCLTLTGKIEFTWQEVMIGFESSLLMFPINLLIVQIFRNTRPRPAQQGREKKPGKNGRVSPNLPPIAGATQAASLTPEAVTKASPSESCTALCCHAPPASPAPQTSPFRCPSACLKRKANYRWCKAIICPPKCNPSLWSAFVHPSPCTVTVCDQISVFRSLKQTLSKTVKIKGIMDHIFLSLGPQAGTLPF